ncbi:helix-turn-helix domain-containing protein [Cutibacterium granulosum]
MVELTGIARPTAGRALHSLAQAGLVRWEGTSDRDPRASWHLL